MELSILFWLRQFASPWLDAFFSFYTSLNNHGEMWLLLCAVLLTFKKTRKFGLLCLVGLGLEFILSDFIIKNIIARPRPFIEVAYTLPIKAPGGYSMPSGHSASSFLMVGMFFGYSQKGKWAVLVLALLMAFSRLYLFVHYPSDVLVGILIGLLCSWVMYQIDVFCTQRTNQNDN